jgi:hypothetical protein
VTLDVLESTLEFLEVVLHLVGVISLADDIERLLVDPLGRWCSLFHAEAVGKAPARFTSYFGRGQIALQVGATDAEAAARFQTFSGLNSLDDAFV